LISLFPFYPDSLRFSGLHCVQLFLYFCGMSTSALLSQDTIVALATSPGANGAIAVIRLSGPQAISITNRVFKGKDLAQQVSHTIHFGTIRDGETIVDEVDRKSTRLNSSHVKISYAVFCLK